MNQQTHTVEKISAADTLSIRQQVLRPNWTIEQCHFEGDQDETTFHIGAFKDGVLIGIATMMRDSCEGWRFFLNTVTKELGVLFWTSASKECVSEKANCFGAMQE